jgi:uncharacterized membrane protein YdbT with pleckstrin-like domain
VAFPRRLLNPSEEIVLDLNPHWLFFAEPAAALAGVVLLTLVVQVQWDPPDLVTLFLVAMILVMAGWVGVRYLKWTTTNFVITSDRMVYRSGVFAKHGIEIPLERDNTVFFSQSIFERNLRTGDLDIESAGERGSQSFTNVRNPSAEQNQIYKQMEDNENRKFDRIKPAAAAPAGDSIPEQIRDLDELRKQVLLSDAEFNEKKQELLDRM